jgi:hypothetical protein
MIATRISAPLRREVRERAGERCEYCLLAESEAIFPHEPDHLIASVDPITGRLVALFNPRIQRWSDHFKLRRGVIVPLTAVGRVTEKLLQLNLGSRVEVRERLVARNAYPNKAR